VDIVVQLEPRDGPAAAVRYQWDADTDILSARLATAGERGGSTGSVEVEGADGSWIVLDLSDERICGVEIAVWPEVDRRPALAPPQAVREAQVRVSSVSRAPEVSSVEVETPTSAESDAQGRIFHFRFGVARECASVRLGRDVLLDVDAANHVAGVWLLNVPPFPGEP
jgi:hypothetical protein